YRIRPYFGRSSEPAAITTGSAEAARTEPDEPEGPVTEPSAGSQTLAGLKSIRRLATFAAAAPTGVTVALSGPTHAVVRWEEHAAAADGFLVELSSHPDRDFQVCALLPPHATSFRKIGLP